MCGSRRQQCQLTAGYSVIISFICECVCHHQFSGDFYKSTASRDVAALTLPAVAGSFLASYPLMKLCCKLWHGMCQGTETQLWAGALQTPISPWNTHPRKALWPKMKFSFYLRKVEDSIPYLFTASFFKKWTEKVWSTWQLFFVRDSKMSQSMSAVFSSSAYEGSYRTPEWRLRYSGAQVTVGYSNEKLSLHWPRKLFRLGGIHTEPSKGLALAWVGNLIGVICIDRPNPLYAISLYPAALKTTLACLHGEIKPITWVVNCVWLSLLDTKQEIPMNPLGFLNYQHTSFIDWLRVVKHENTIVAQLNVERRIRLDGVKCLIQECSDWNLSLSFGATWLVCQHRGHKVTSHLHAVSHHQRYSWLGTLIKFPRVLRYVFAEAQVRIVKGSQFRRFQSGGPAAFEVHYKLISYLHNAHPPA